MCSVYKIEKDELWWNQTAASQYLCSAAHCQLSVPSHCLGTHGHWTCAVANPNDMEFTAHICVLLRGQHHVIWTIIKRLFSFQTSDAFSALQALVTVRYINIQFPLPAIAINAYKLSISDTLQLMLHILLGRLPKVDLIILEGGKMSVRTSVRTSVGPYVRPSTKSFFDFNEIWYIGRGR